MKFLHTPFVIVNLQTIFHTQCKFRVPSSSGSLVKTIKPNAKEFRTVTRLLLYILPALEYYPNRNRLSFH
jgi:hypothetical protein